eukprot:tig00000137_g8137.t1
MELEDEEAAHDAHDVLEHFGAHGVPEHIMEPPLALAEGESGRTRARKISEHSKAYEKTRAMLYSAVANHPTFLAQRLQLLGETPSVKRLSKEKILRIALAIGMDLEPYRPFAGPMQKHKVALPEGLAPPPAAAREARGAGGVSARKSAYLADREALRSYVSSHPEFRRHRPAFLGPHYREVGKLPKERLLHVAHKLRVDLSDFVHYAGTLPADYYALCDELRNALTHREDDELAALAPPRAPPPCAPARLGARPPPPPRPAPTPRQAGAGPSAAPALLPGAPPAAYGAFFEAPSPASPSPTTPTAPSASPTPGRTCTRRRRSHSGGTRPRPPPPRRPLLPPPGPAPYPETLRTPTLPSQAPGPDAAAGALLRGIAGDPHAYPDALWTPLGPPPPSGHG